MSSSFPRAQTKYFTDIYLNKIFVFQILNTLELFHKQVRRHAGRNVAGSEHQTEPGPRRVQVILERCCRCPSQLTEVGLMKAVWPSAVVDPPDPPTPSHSL